MKKNLITLGLLVSVFFAGAAFACDMPGMQNHSKPCPVKDNKTNPKKETVSSEKVKQPQPKTITNPEEHKH